MTRMWRVISWSLCRQAPAGLSNLKLSRTPQETFLNANKKPAFRESQLMRVLDAMGPIHGQLRGSEPGRTECPKPQHVQTVPGRLGDS